MGALAALSVMVDGTKTLLSAAEERFVTCILTVFSPVTTWLSSTVGNLSDCRSRGHEIDPGPVPYFHGD